MPITCKNKQVELVVSAISKALERDQYEDNWSSVIIDNVQIWSYIKDGAKLYSVCKGTDVRYDYQETKKLDAIRKFINLVSVDFSMPVPYI